MHARITTDVSAKLIKILNGDKERICGVMNKLREDLEENPEALAYFRRCRYEKEPDDYFEYSCHWITNGTWHHLDFLVSDKQALDGILLVDEVS